MSMDRSINPQDAVEIFQWRYKEARRAFNAGEMTEAVFRATLYGLGYRGQELSAEVNLQISEREAKMQEGYFVEHNGDQWQSVFPSSEASKSQLHVTIIDALDYMVQERGVRRQQIRVLKRRA